MYLQILGIFGSDIKRRTSLCLAKADLSHKCCVSAVASCLVFFRSDWVPCSIGAMCYVRFVLATALTQKLRIFSASLFAICLLWCVVLSSCGGEVLKVGPCAAGACGTPPGPEGSNGTRFRRGAAVRLTGAEPPWTIALPAAAGYRQLFQ